MAEAFRSRPIPAYRSKSNTSFPITGDSEGCSRGLPIYDELLSVLDGFSRATDPEALTGSGILPE